MESSEQCQFCGGRLEVINMYSDHYMCDTCDYEFNLDGVITESEYIKEESK